MGRSRLRWRLSGIITAIVLAERGDGWVHLVESNNKKASFLRSAIRETGARGVGSRDPHRGGNSRYGTTRRPVGRALADLDTLLGFAQPWARLNPDLSLWFHKGRIIAARSKMRLAGGTSIW